MKMVYTTLISCALFTSCFHTGISSEDLKDLEEISFDWGFIQSLKKFFIKERPAINPYGYKITLSSYDKNWMGKEFSTEETELLAIILGQAQEYCPSLWAPYGTTHTYIAHPTLKTWKLFEKFIKKFNENYPNEPIAL